MYKDIISYQLAKNTSEEKLVQIAGQIVEDWMKKLPGFVSWEIMKNEDGSFTDVVTWKQESDAKAAEKEMYNIPNASDWYGCYEEGSISTKKLTGIASF